MPRSIWKGAITFGLVHVPVALYPASDEIGIDFDWLDRRSMDPVGYRRINKRTKKEIASSDIVKGIKQPNGEYVVLSEDEIKQALPKSTQTIEIERFVHASELKFSSLEKPYFLEPFGKSDKVYALLRECMIAAEVIAIARIVMHTKEHLAALIPDGGVLMLNTIRWDQEIRSTDELKLPAAGKGSLVKAEELKMGLQLIKSMTAPWKHGEFTDQFTAAVNKVVSRKVKAGKTEQVTPLEEVDAPAGRSNVIDLTQLLAQSLSKRKGVANADPAPGRRRRTGASRPTRRSA